MERNPGGSLPSVYCSPCARSPGWSRAYRSLDEEIPARFAQDICHVLMHIMFQFFLVLCCGVLEDLSNVFLGGIIGNHTVKIGRHGYRHEIFEAAQGQMFSAPGTLDFPHRLLHGYFSNSTFQYDASTMFRKGFHSSYRRLFSVKGLYGVHRGRLGLTMSFIPASSGV